MASQFNSSDKSLGTLSNLNLTFTSTGSAAGVRAVDPQMSGKYYVEFAKNTNSSGSDAVGIANAAAPYSAFNSGKDGAWCQWVGNTWTNGTSQTALGLFWSSCDMAVDLDNKLIWFRTDGGSWNGSGTANPATATGGWDISAFCAAGVFPAIGIVNSGGVYSCNFGDTTFARTKPTGFVAWPTLVAGIKIDPAACKNNTSTSSPTSLALSGVNTSQTNSILYVVANLSGGGRTVSSISDTAGLTWTRRKQQSYNAGANTLEVWTAPAPAQLSSDTITVNFSAAPTNGAQVASFAFAGNGATSILKDADASLPDAASGSSTTASVTGYNTSGEDIVLGIISTSGGGFSGAPTPPSGWANIQSMYAGVGTGMTISLVGAYKSTAVASGSLSETIPSTTPWAEVVDAVGTSTTLALTASIADDTGLAATLGAAYELVAPIADDAGLSATLSYWWDLSASIADDTALDASLVGAGFTSFNAFDKNGANVTLSNHNLSAVPATSAFALVRGADGKKSGTFYWEMAVTWGTSANQGVGVIGPYGRSTAFDFGKYGAVLVKNGDIYLGGGLAISTGVASPSTVDIALDLDNGKVWFRPNGGNWNGSGTADPATNVGGFNIAGNMGAGLWPALFLDDTMAVAANFGGNTFARSAPFAGWPQNNGGIDIDAAASENVSFVGGSSNSAASINTSGPGHIVLVTIYNQKSGGAPTVSSVAATGLTFARRKQLQWADGSGANANCLETWWAYATAQQTSNAVNVTLSGATDAGVVSVCAFQGNINSLSPFDGNVALPASANNNTTNPSVSISTNADAFAFAAIGEGSADVSANPITKGLGSGLISGAREAGGTRVTFGSLEARYLFEQATGTGMPFGAFTSAGYWGIVADAIAPSLLITDDGGLFAYLSVRPMTDLIASIHDDNGLIASFTDLLIATLSDDNGLTAVLTTVSRDLSAGIADDLGLTALLDVIDVSNLHVTLLDDAGVTAALSVTTAHIPVQQVIICV